MRHFNAGENLDLLTRHQDTRRFAPKKAFGKVTKGTQGHDYKIVVRVYGDWRPKKGYLHELLRVSDTIWVTRIGRRLNKKDDTTNLPEICEIVGTLTDDEFEKRRAKLK
jgi:hypothetical protein